MAKKIETKQIEPFQFKPGQSGNPNGRPKLPDDIVKSRKLNQIQVSRLINKYMNMPVSEIAAEITNPETKSLEAMIGRIIYEAQKSGDYSRVNFLFDRMIGKVTEKVEHRLPKPTVIKMIGPEAGAMILGHEANDEDEE